MPLFQTAEHPIDFKRSTSALLTPPLEDHKQLLVFGLRHQRAPIAIREKLAFDLSEVPQALQQLLAFSADTQAESVLPENVIEEAVMLSTCNRIELYVTTPSPKAALRQIEAFLAAYKQIDASIFESYSSVLEGQEAIRHLFNVASGIDSLILGEDQILSQVRDAHRLATEAQTVGHYLDQVFKKALTVGKAVRTETGIATRDINIAKAAFEFVQVHHADCLKNPIAVIGGGKMAEIMLTCLDSVLPMDAACRQQIKVMNRTVERATALAKRYGFSAYGWDALEQVIYEAETIFVATGSPHYVLTSQHLHVAPRPKVLMDISVPRNVDPVVGQYNGISLYNTDDLVGYSGYTGEHRLRLIEQANAIMDREFEQFREWEADRRVAPVIAQLRRQFEQMRERELQEFVSGHPDLASFLPDLEQLTKALLNKFLHHPTVQIKSVGQNEAERVALAENLIMLERLFSLSPDAIKSKRVLDEESVVLSQQAVALSLATRSERAARSAM